MKTARTELGRHPERGHHDEATVHAILDEAPFCHVGFAIDGQPYVIPTIHARLDRRLYVHGALASRMLRSMADGVPLCVSATILDGLVLARSTFRHSMNYRSVVVIGRAHDVTDPREKERALEAIVEHVAAGRSAVARPPSEKELRVTRVLCIPVTEASAKIRTGPPVDDPADIARPCWGGVVPVSLAWGVPEPDEHVAAGQEPPIGPCGRRPLQRAPSTSSA